MSGGLSLLCAPLFFSVALFAWAQTPAPLGFVQRALAQDLVSFDVFGDGIPAPLTGIPGDPERGRAIFLNETGAHCLLCHSVATLDAPFQGDVAPDLTKVGDRLESAQIRLRIVDPTLLNPETAMPAYYRTHGLRQVGEDYRGQAVLTAQEVEDLVAYLITLRSQE